MAYTVGERPPAMCVSYEGPLGSWDSGFLVWRGLDMAREQGMVQWDPGAGEWFVPSGAGDEQP